VNLPNEVCITVSYFAQRSLPRQRGRIYVGPLNGSAMEDTGGDARVTPQCRSDLAAAFKRLGAFEDALAWAVFSRKDNEARGPIGGGWVDNAFDTQRRRGRDASVRTSWVR
jgi:hypothetical protein